MKKIKYLFLILLSLLILPFGVYAEGEDEETVESEEVDNQVVVYFFRGEGCSHCAEAEAWFESIEEEYGEKFRIQDYETWYNAENSELMSRVVKARKDDESNIGVPYIIIGDQSWIGFDKSYSQEIIDKINQLYDQDVEERYDIMAFVDTNVDLANDDAKSSGNDVVALFLIIIVCAGIGTGIYFARKQNA